MSARTPITQGITGTGIRAGMLIDWFGPGTLDDLKDWHYPHVSKDVLPYLREHGVADAMLSANPARILAG